MNEVCPWWGAMVAKVQNTSSHPIMHSAVDNTNWFSPTNAQFFQQSGSDWGRIMFSPQTTRSGVRLKACGCLVVFGAHPSSFGLISTWHTKKRFICCLIDWMQNTWLHESGSVRGFLLLTDSFPLPLLPHCLFSVGTLGLKRVWSRSATCKESWITSLWYGTIQIKLNWFDLHRYTVHVHGESAWPLVFLAVRLHLTIQRQVNRVSSCNKVGLNMCVDVCLYMWAPHLLPNIHYDVFYFTSTLVAIEEKQEKQ